MGTRDGVSLISLFLWVGRVRGSALPTEGKLLLEALESKFPGVRDFAT